MVEMEVGQHQHRLELFGEGKGDFLCFLSFFSLFFLLLILSFMHILHGPFNTHFFIPYKIL